MTKKKESINIRITEAELRGLLEARITSAHRDLISSVIMANLAKTEIGFEQLFKSMQGIAPSSKFNVGDEVWVKYTNLPTWRYDEKLMRDKDIIFKEMVKCTISEIDLQLKDGIRLKHRCVKSKESDITTDDYLVAEQNLRKIEDPFMSGGEELPF